MPGWLTVIGAIFQVVLLLLQSHNAQAQEERDVKASQAKEISDAIASGDVSRINASIGKLRR